MKELVKCILIMGASSDVGISLIHKIYKDFDILLCHCNTGNGKLELLQKQLGGKIKIYHANLEQKESIQLFLTKIRKEEDVTHFVFLSASKLEQIKFQKTKSERYQQQLQVQVLSAVEILNYCLPIMAKNDYGRIVFMLSSVVEGKPPKYLTPYVVAKFAMLGLMKSLSVEYAHKNISVNGVSPGMMSTNFLSELPELVIKMQESANQKKKLIAVEDVLEAIMFLLSENAEFITGNSILVDGGN